MEWNDEIQERVTIPVDGIDSAEVVGSNPTGPTSNVLRLRNSETLKRAEDQGPPAELETFQTSQQIQVDNLIANVA